MDRLREPSVCAYCGRPDPETRDHVPPKALFPSGSFDLLTVPCCERCRKPQSLDDEYFRAALLVAEELQNSQEALIAQSAVIRSFHRPRGQRLARRIVGAFEEVDIVSPGGVWIGRQPALRLERDRLNRVAERFVRALYFKERGCPVPEGWRVKNTRWSGKQVEDFSKLVSQSGRQWSSIRQVGAPVFEYCFASAADDSPHSYWVSCFYRRLFFMGSIQPPKPHEDSLLAG